MSLGRDSGGVGAWALLAHTGCVSDFYANFLGNPAQSWSLPCTLPFPSVKMPRLHASSLRLFSSSYIRWVLKTVYFLAGLSDFFPQQEGSFHLPLRQAHWSPGLAQLGARPQRASAHASQSLPPDGGMVGRCVPSGDSPHGKLLQKASVQAQKVWGPAGLQASW